MWNACSVGISIGQKMTTDIETTIIMMTCGRLTKVLLTGAVAEAFLVQW